MFFYIMWTSLCFSSRRRHTRCSLVTGVQTCALPIYRAVLVTPRHPRDVEMRPGDAVLDIAFEELRRGDRAAFARADILHVGDRAVDQLVVGGREREAPQLVVRRLARGEQVGGERVVIGEDAGILDRKSTRLNSSH